MAVAARAPIWGVAYLVLGLLTFSLQDVAVKWLGGAYPIGEMVIFRSIVALPCALLFVWLEGQRGLPSTRRPGLEYLRGACLLLSFTTYMMGLAALPLAHAAAIRLSTPLIITLLSVLLLRERVELRRWAALAVGFGGLLLLADLGAASVSLGALAVLISVISYAFAVTITRRLRADDSSATMAYYSSLVYLAGSAILAPLAIAVGEVGAHPSIAFLFRAWQMPSPLDLAIMGGMGLTWATGMYLMARAYSVAPASLAAPFEYVALPINAAWGFLLWQEIPGLATWAGALLTVASGLYILRREQQARKGP